MTKVYVRTTKRFLEGSLKGMVRSDVLEVPNEEVAKRMVKDCPKGRVIGGGYFGKRSSSLEGEMSFQFIQGKKPLQCPNNPEILFDNGEQNAEFIASLFKENSSIF
jgi:hypothetical protein